MSVESWGEFNATATPLRYGSVGNDDLGEVGYPQDGASFPVLAIKGGSAEAVRRGRESTTLVYKLLANLPLSIRANGKPISEENYLMLSGQATRLNITQVRPIDEEGLAILECEGSN